MDNKLIHGDSLTILRQMDSDSIDAIITDPPYGINYKSNFGKKTGLAISLMISCRLSGGCMMAIECLKTAAVRYVLAAGMCNISLLRLPR